MRKHVLVRAGDLTGALENNDQIQPISDFS